MSKYNCIIVEDGYGGLRVKFELKAGDFTQSNLSDAMILSTSFLSS
jgi:hypothetical protein